jgi:hypothetical protein
MQPSQEYRLELSLPFPPVFEKLLAEFLKVCDCGLAEEEQLNLEEAVREAVYQLGPESGDGRCFLALRGAAGQMVVRVGDQRGNPDLGAAEGGWTSPLRRLFSKVEYLQRPGVRELQLTYDCVKEVAVEFTSPLPLFEHQVIAGATLAG